VPPALVRAEPFFHGLWELEKILADRDVKMTPEERIVISAAVQSLKALVSESRPL
jgi:hypothetical protein